MERFVTDTIGALSFSLKSFEEKLNKIEFEMYRIEDDLTEDSQDAMWMAHFCREDLKELTYTVEHLNVPNILTPTETISEKALKASMLPEKEFQSWINKHIVEQASLKRRWTGILRQKSYKMLVNEYGYSCLANKKHLLNDIVYGNNSNLKYAYATILLEAKY